MQHMSGLESVQTDVFLMEMCWTFMQISSPPSKGFQGFSIILNGCAERHLLLNMSSPTTLVQQAEAGGRNEKNLHKRSAEAFFRDGHTL